MFPSELRGSLPRRVRLNSTNASPLLVAVLLLMGLGGAALGYDCYFDVKEVGQRTALRQAGRDTVGKVSATHAGHGPATVSYSFKVNDGYYSGRAEMPDYRLVLHESDPIAVRYLPTDPGAESPGRLGMVRSRGYGFDSSGICALFHLNGDRPIGTLVSRSRVGTRREANRRDRDRLQRR